MTVILYRPVLQVVIANQSVQTIKVTKQVELTATVTSLQAK